MMSIGKSRWLLLSIYKPPCQNDAYFLGEIQNFVDFCAKSVQNLLLSTWIQLAILFRLSLIVMICLVWLEPQLVLNPHRGDALISCWPTKNTVSKTLKPVECHTKISLNNGRFEFSSVDTTLVFSEICKTDSSKTTNGAIPTDKLKLASSGCYKEMTYHVN